MRACVVCAVTLENFVVEEADMSIRTLTTLVASAALLAACATAEPEIPQGILAAGDPAKPVVAAVETVVTTDPTVDADDPAFWTDPRDPSRAVMFGTDKSDGLYVHNLDGTVRQFFPDGPMNNVDVRSGFMVDGKAMVLVAAAERDRFGIMTWLMDPATLEVRRWGFIPTNMGEPYGFCMGQRGDAYYLVPNNKAGLIQQIRVTAGPNGPVSVVEKSMQLGSQTEGCVVDDAADLLYVGEEDVGIWRFDFDPAGSSAPTEIQPIDRVRLTDDVEGLTIMRDGANKYLIASSQGDSTYPVWRVTGTGAQTAYAYVGRFTIVDGVATTSGQAVDAVTHTDGLDAWSGAIGPWPQGALAFHDDSDAPNRGQQNYKMVDWREIKRALGIN